MLVGAGGHARACIDVVELEDRFNIHALIGLQEEIGREVFQYPVLGTDEDLSEIYIDASHALVTIGQIKTPEHRIRLYYLLKKIGFILPSIISPLAHVSSHATLGEGTIVMHGAIVNAGAVIGRNCIINSHALIEHDCKIGDHNHISTSAAINSGVIIGTGTFVGSNTSIRQNTEIGDNCVIGMGQNIVKNLNSETCVPLFKR